MARYIPIQRKLHQNSGWKAGQDLSFATEMALVPLLTEELNNTMPYMAIAFSENSQTQSGFELVGIQSLQPGRNLLIHPDGRWMGVYMPAFYRRYPFAMVQEKDTDKLHLCIDTDSPLFHEQMEEGDTALLDDEGAPSEKVKGIINFLQQCHANQNLTQQLVSALKDAGLIIPWKLELKQPSADGGEENIPVSGLFRIDKQALKNLEAETLAEFNKTGALAMAYCQMLSESRLKNLATYYRLHDQVAQQQARQASAQEADLDHLFGESSDEDDVFKF